MAAAGWTLFDTAIGRCGIGWNADGLTCVQLPGAGDGRMAARLAARSSAARAEPPTTVRQSVELIAASLAGQPADLAGIALDRGGIPAFELSVYDLARAIPWGKTTTYGEIAARLGDRALARDVGRALGRNPWPIVVPCHRVLAAGGMPGGFSAPGGTATKLRLLTIEGALDQPDLFAMPTGRA